MEKRENVCITLSTAHLLFAISVTHPLHKMNDDRIYYQLPVFRFTKWIRGRIHKGEGIFTLIPREGGILIQTYVSCVSIDTGCHITQEHVVLLPGKM